MCEYFENRFQSTADDEDENASAATVPETDHCLRYGGAQAGDDDAQKAKEAELLKRKAEVRKRLEESAQAKKSKKGFLTPERKKKLRKLLMMKAAEDLKNQQLAKEQERQRILAERIVPMPSIDNVDDKAKLEEIHAKLFKRFLELEGAKHDISHAVKAKEAEIAKLTIEVNDLRGKFIKPSLKKVATYENKFKSMGGPKKEDKADFRSNLKVVKKENVLEELEKLSTKEKKPDWKKKDAGAPPPPLAVAKPDAAAVAAAAAAKTEEPEAAPADEEPEEGAEDEEGEEDEE